MEIWAAGYKVRTINPLTEEKALIEGAEFIGEFFVLSVSISLIVLEYNRSAKKEAEKAETLMVEAAAERKDLQRKLRALDLRLQALEHTVERSSQSMFALLQGGAQYKPPPKGKLVKIVDDDADFSDDDDDDNDDEKKEEKKEEEKEEKKEVSTSAATSRSASTTEGEQPTEPKQQRAGKVWWWPW